MASVGAAADVSSPGPFGAAAVVASVAGAAVVAASVAAAVVDAAVVSLCVPFVSEPPVDTAAADGGALRCDALTRNVSVRHSVYSCCRRGLNGCRLIR